MEKEQREKEEEKKCEEERQEREKQAEIAAAVLAPPMKPAEVKTDAEGTRQPEGPAHAQPTNAGTQPGDKPSPPPPEVKQGCRCVIS